MDRMVCDLHSQSELRPEKKGALIPPTPGAGSMATAQGDSILTNHCSFYFSESFQRLKT
jgi:hypothetical protein